jgi:sulfatase modifying factor 1
MKTKTAYVVAALMAIAFAAQATTIDLVPVGNPGNAGELSGVGAGGYGPDAICGAVDCIYQIGKYEITAGQYTEFLNAVADEDAYGLYNTSMWSDDYGCKIERTGSSPNYSYSVAADRADRPVNYVSWGDAARFCNWCTTASQPERRDFQRRRTARITSTVRPASRR